MSKKFLTIDEYLEKYSQTLSMTNYLMGMAVNKSTSPFPPEFIKVGMLKWEDGSANCWGGPYKGNYVFCKVEDHTFTVGNLKSLAEIAEHWKSYITYSTHNTINGGRALQKYFPEIKDWYFIQKTTDGKECSRTSFTHQELQHYLTNATKEELAYREDRIKEKMEGLITNYALSIELPVKFYLCGNDDCSYTGYFPTKDAALKTLEFFIEEQPDISWIQEKFEFTN